jgi:hypothetical protein
MQAAVDHGQDKAICRNRYQENHHKEEKQRRLPKASDAGRAGKNSILLRTAQAMQCLASGAA